MSTLWKKYKLGELGKVVTGGTPPGRLPTHFGNYIPFITPSDFGDYLKTAYSAKRYISEEGYRANRNRILPANSVLVTCIGSDMGKVVVNKRECLTNQQINSIIPNNQIVDYNFLYYSIINQYDLLRSIASDGTTMPIINKSEFENIEIAAPEDINEQQRIASILSSLDDKIELNRRMNQTLEQIAATLFKKYFPSIELIDLDELIELNPRIELKKNTIATYVEMADLPEQCSSISSSCQRAFNGGSKFQNGDTLLARITPCLENGKTAFIDILENDNEVAFGSTEFIVMRAKKNVSKYFPYFVARDKNFREFAIRSMVGTSGRQRVQTDMLYSFGLPKPEPNSMKQFDKAVDSIFKQIKSNTNESKTLEAIRDTLLPKLMSGEIDITAINQPFDELRVTKSESNEEVLI